MHRRSKIATTALIAGALILPSSVAHAVPTSATTAADCLADIEHVKDTVEYENLTAEGGTVGFYVCTPDSAHVQVERDNESVGSVSVDLSTDEVMRDIELKVEDEPGPPPVASSPSLVEAERSAALLADDPSPIKEKYRQIKSQYTESISFHIWYGYAGNDYPKFTNRIKNTVNLNIGKRTIQDVSVAWTSLGNRPVAPRMGVRLMRENGLFPPSYVEQVYLGSGTGADYHYRTSHSEAGTLSPTEATNNYSIEVSYYEWWDQNDGSSQKLTLEGDMGTGHRWLCAAKKVCKFPNGKEAPVI